MTLRQIIKGVENVRSPIDIKLLKMGDCKINSFIEIADYMISKLNNMKRRKQNEYENYCISNVNQNNNSDTNLGNQIPIHTKNINFYDRFLDHMHFFSN